MSVSPINPDSGSGLTVNLNLASYMPSSFSFGSFDGGFPAQFPFGTIDNMNFSDAFGDDDGNSVTSLLNGLGTSSINDGGVDPTSTAGTWTDGTAAASANAPVVNPNGTTTVQVGQWGQSGSQNTTVIGALKNLGYSDTQIANGNLVNQVAQMNGLSDPNQIQAGQNLILPTNPAGGSNTANGTGTVNGPSTQTPQQLYDQAGNNFFQTVQNVPQDSSDGQALANIRQQVASEAANAKAAGQDYDSVGNFTSRALNWAMGVGQSNPNDNTAYNVASSALAFMKAQQAMQGQGTSTQ